MQGHQSSNRQRRLLRQKDEHPKTGMIDSIKGYLTNLSYGLQGISFSFCNRPKLQKPEKLVLYVGGKNFSSQEECMSEHRSIIWFTYRKNCKITVTLTSDVGWGCMIRVAQMALAESIRRLFKANHTRVSYSYLIAAFLQSQTTNKYSLSRFLEMASKLFLKQPGQWFSISQTAIILQELHHLNPLKGTESLQVIVNHQALVLSAAEALLQDKESIRAVQRQFGKHKPLISFSQPTSSAKSLLIIITAQLGNKEVAEKNYGYLLEVMTWPWTVGCLGGRPKQARFLTGRNADKLSYLDPHYVEKEIDRINLAQEIDKFSCKQYRLMDRFDLDPNIAFCFFVKDRADLEALSQCIDRWKGEGVIQLNKKIEVQKSEWIQFGTTAPHRQPSEDDILDWRSNSSMESSFLMD